jgi:hypothetical protein
MKRSDVYTLLLGLAVAAGTVIAVAILTKGQHFRDGEDWLNANHCMLCGGSLSAEVTGIKVCTECGERTAILHAETE